MSLKDIQKQFILDQIWILTIQASFQRAKVYKGHQNKESRKLELRKQIEDISKQYIIPVSEEQHINNIKSICCANDIGLNINFGVAQKLLNLYLKYLWTLGFIPCVPPHFPVDRMIQEALKYKSLFNWTALTDVTAYLNFISFAKDEMKKRNLASLAELELIVYNVWVSRNRK